MERRIRELLERFEKVEELLGHPDVLANQKQYRELTQEHSYLSEVKEVWGKIQETEKQLEEDEKLIRSESDPELLETIRGEIQLFQVSLPKLRLKLENLLVPPDPFDSRSVIMEIRAGPAGTKPPFLSATASGCINAMPIPKAGDMKLSLQPHLKEGDLKSTS